MENTKKEKQKFRPYVDGLVEMGRRYHQGRITLEQMLYPHIRKPNQSDEMWVETLEVVTQLPAADIQKRLKELRAEIAESDAEIRRMYEQGEVTLKVLILKIIDKTLMSREKVVSAVMIVTGEPEEKIRDTIQGLLDDGLLNGVML